MKILRTTLGTLTSSCIHSTCLRQWHAAPILMYIPIYSCCEGSKQQMAGTSLHLLPCKPALHRVAMALPAADIFLLAYLALQYHVVPAELPVHRAELNV
mmetsp:Transcript_26948/g.58879  ORF Transcript_26948/g.58879 Transcript_26948/m.58879 type:complete len:99 (-) Transcript_26948:1807-2103(-)